MYTDPFDAAEALRQRADRLEARGLRMQRLLDEMPDEPGTVITFVKIMSGTAYTYAAICYLTHGGLARWCTTGPASPKAITKEDLVGWMLGGNGVEELWVAIEFAAL